MRIFRKRGNIWIWGAAGMIVGPFILNKTAQVTGISLGLPQVGSGSGS